MLLGARDREGDIICTIIVSHLRGHNLAPSRSRTRDETAPMRYWYHEDAKLGHDSTIASARHQSRVGAISPCRREREIAMAPTVHRNLCMCSI